MPELAPAGRRVVAAAPPIASLAYAWGLLETDASVRTFALAAAAPLLASLSARWAVRIAAAAAVLAGSMLVVAGTSVTTARGTAQRGLEEIYAVAPPFAAAEHPDLHALIVLAVVVFSLAVALTAAARPFLAAALITAAVGWPATVLLSDHPLRLGALALTAALWPIAVSAHRGRRGIAPGLAVTAAVVAIAVAGASAGARPSVAAVDWKGWNLFAGSTAARTVALVWTSNYDGIEFPAEKTTVLRITAPRRALFWRATTLDTFVGENWFESLYAIGEAGGSRVLPRDALLPRASSVREDWVKQEVEVRALTDDHVIAAAQPMAIEGAPERWIRSLSGGVMKVKQGAGELRRYTVWSYVPSPSPAELVRSRPDYPPSLARYLDVGRPVVPAFGVRGRAASIEGIFADPRYQAIWPYAPLWRRAQQLAAGASSPYEATVRIERWLRSAGGFIYDERPVRAAGVPPLVGFLEQTKAGYCQQFAGSMALMLRYLGIPSRVAVGFTSGSWNDGHWTVTDHDAHAWVETWFAGYGWLAFDPTPGRGTLTATYTNASDSADAILALGTGRFLDLGAVGQSTAPSATASAPRQTAQSDPPWAVIAGLGAALLAILTLAAAKAARRYRRSHVRDPRRRASAARAELVGFVRDQGLPVAATASVSDLAVVLRRLGVGSDAFAAAFARARYGPPSGAEDAAESTRRELRRLLSALRARLGPGRRIRGFFAVWSLRDG